MHASDCSVNRSVSYVLGNVKLWLYAQLNIHTRKGSLVVRRLIIKTTVRWMYKCILVSSTDEKFITFIFTAAFDSVQLDSKDWIPVKWGSQVNTHTHICKTSMLTVVRLCYHLTCSLMMHKCVCIWVLVVSIKYKVLKIYFM